MIAGLLRKHDTNNIDKAPFLGDLPILGALFRSTSLPARRDRAGDHRHAVSGASGVRPDRAADRRLSHARTTPQRVFGGQIVTGVSRSLRPAVQAPPVTATGSAARCRCRSSGVQAVTRGSFRKDATMRSKLLLIALGAALAACNAPDMPRQGMSRGQRARSYSRRLRVRRRGSRRRARSGRSRAARRLVPGLDLGYGDTRLSSTASMPAPPAARSPTLPAITACWSRRRSGHRRRGPARHASGSSSAAAARRVPNCPELEPLRRSRTSTTRRMSNSAAR